MSADQGPSYDPFDFDLDADPYPTFRRLRDEAPLYENADLGFFALSRFEDVESASVDWATYRSGRGTVLELIRLEWEVPEGLFIFEDPPVHDIHRSILARAFTPRRMARIEEQVRDFCSRSLDPFVDAHGFDFVRDLGATMPMRTIGMLLGIPEADQEALRDSFDETLRIESGDMPTSGPEREVSYQFEEYIDWRAEHPSDDLMTELLAAEFTDEGGGTRTLRRDEVVTMVGLLAAAGNETTNRLIGWAGKVLAEHPTQRAELAADPSLVPGAIEELLRFEAPSPVQARWVARDVTHHGRTVPAGSIMLLLTAAANRDERHFDDADRFDIHRRIDHHVAFGRGIHYCLGAALARLEGRVALEEVLARFPDWEVDWSLAERAHTSTVRGWESLPVVFG